MRTSETTEKRDCLVPSLRGGGREEPSKQSLPLAGKGWLLSFARAVE